MPYLKISILLLFLIVGPFANSQTVYKTPSGAKYHLASCRMVKNVSEEIMVEQAIQLGLQPCKICNPENIYTAGSGPSKAKGEAKKTVQCKGFTKAGTRCRHMTSIANGYCYQHQP